MNNTKHESYMIEVISPAFGVLFVSSQFKQDGSDLDKFLKYALDYPYAFPLWFGPFVCFLNIHHPDYVKTLLTSTGV